MKRRYGFPFTGFIASVARFLVPQGAITGDSRNWLLDPNEGKLVGRRGSSIVGDTLPTPTGILEAKWGAAAQAMLELPSPSMTYPTHAALYADESGSVKHEGQVYFYAPDATTKNQVIGKAFGSTHYDNNGPAFPNMRYVPLAYSDSDGVTGITRAAFEEARRHVAAGSRNVRIANDWLHMPNFQGTPAKWDMRFNSESGSGSEVERLYPIGHLPPLWCPIVTQAGGGASGPWEANDAFYVSVAFEYEDGSVSMPATPRAVNSVLSSGFGRVVLTAASAAYARVEWRNIPKGGPGVVRKLLLRSPKVDSSTVGAEPDISDLRIVAVIDNDQTSYDDPNGNDSSLLDDESLVRFDHKWPDRARYIFTFKERVAMGYLKPNPCAIIVAPVGANVAYDRNFSEQDSLGTVVMCARVTSTDLVLERVGVGTTTIALSSSKTLQSVVDEINATAIAGGNGGQWRAQMVPGADGNATSDKLALTTQAVANSSVAGGDLDTVTTATANGFADVAIGMKVSGHANIPAGCHVVSKASSTSVDISPAASGALGPVSLTFTFDSGDDATTGTNGSLIAYCGGLPAVLPFKDEFLDKFKTQKRSVVFTGASPGHPKNAADSYYVGNRRTAPGRLGIIMGGAELPDAGFIAMSKGTALLVNTRGNDTGDDGDYRVVVMNPHRGCISPHSIVEGDGWVGFLSDEGYVVSSDRREVIITRALWSASTGTGVFSYAIQTCRASARSDGSNFPFYAKVMSGRLYIAYAFDANTVFQQVYDFSEGISASGLEEVLRDGREPYGWSAPLTIPSVTAMCEVAKSDGLHRYAAISGNAGSAGDGRIDEIEVGRTDNGSTVTATAYTATDLADVLEDKDLRHVRALAKKDGTGLTVAVQTDKARTAEDSLVVGTSGTDIFKIASMPPNSRSRSPKEVFELKINDDGSGTNPPEVWGVECEFEESKTY